MVSIQLPERVESKNECGKERVPFRIYGIVLTDVPTAQCRGVTDFDKQRQSNKGMARAR